MVDNVNKRTVKNDLLVIQRRLVDIRKGLNLTQAELGNRVGRSQQYICKFEKCDGKTIDALWDIANVLGYEIVLVKKE